MLRGTDADTPQIRGHSTAAEDVILYVLSVISLPEMQRIKLDFPCYLYFSLNNCLPYMINKVKYLKKAHFF